MQAIPNVSIVDEVISTCYRLFGTPPFDYAPFDYRLFDCAQSGGKCEMRENGLAKMRSTGKEILRKVLRDACDLRAFDEIFGRQKPVVGREKMDTIIPIDQPANVMQNMG
jgi:hypothetical protein